ncbi:MAG: cell surface protein SprA [Sphingobacteriales bacterium]
MTKILTLKSYACILIIFAFCGVGRAFAQQLGDPTIVTPPKDSIKVQEPYNIRQSNNMRLRQGVFDADPPNLIRTIEYDAATNQYILYERVGDMLYRAPQYLTYMQYLAIKQQETERDYFKTLADKYAYQSQQPGFIPQIKVHSQTFEQIFGGPNIDIKAQGSANATFAGQLNKNDNPLFNSQQRNQFNFNFDQQIQLNVTGNIGTNLTVATNYNTNAQFQFDNQIKLDYKGKQDDIIQEIQAGTVSMPLNTTLITGTQALFGVKTKLKFGKLNITSIMSQQRSQSKTITITNGSEQGNFKLTTDAYDANKHYFLAQYFRDNYDKALANIPIISSNVNITKIEVWITNRNNSTTNSRDVLAFMDLGENKPYNKPLIQGGSAYSNLPAGTDVPGFIQQSNSLLKNLPAGARLTNSNDIATYFNNSGATDNYAKLTYARQLTTKEYTLHPQLGYISLNYPLNNDEVLAVAYQYTYNGVTYQVGEFSSDRPVNNNTPNVLYVKMLKNTLLKPNLPIWNLMMKNIYSLGAYQISSTNFKMAISRLDNNSGILKPIMSEGKNTTGKLWLQLTGLDNLDQQNQKKPDGYFDFLSGITIDPQNGLLIFPEVEPFGADLAAKFAPGEQSLINTYVYQPLYDSTQTVAQQFYPQLNRYVIQGTYTSQGGSEYQLNATNIPQGSVVVTVGAQKLVEGNDYTVDYNAGTIRVLNQSILSSGQPITVNLENNELFGVQQKSLYGSRFDYQVSPKLALGATIMHLTEQPISQNEAVGSESISNTKWGFDANYSSPSRMLTRLVDDIPLIHTKVPSSVNFSGEFAQLLPGTPSTLNYAGSKSGTAYLDDFENSQSQIDLKSANTWQISGTPQLFPESQRFDDLSYGFNRARLAFYNIDPTFYTSTTIPVSRAELSKPYVREVLQTEVFPYIQSVTGQPQILPTLDLAFYPNTRGPYNYVTTGINADGTLQNPTGRWGGMMRAISTNDFEALNVTYIEFWVLDPFINKPNSTGGDLYFNLGSISEDILKDGRKSMENGLPVNGDLSTVDTTAWGRVAKLQPVVNVFDNDPNSRALQDVGLDGLADADERSKFNPQVQAIKAQVTPAAATTIATDPSSDDYQYYQGPALDQAKAGILQRYSKYNGTDGNSKTAAQSQAQLGLQTSASTSLPDAEDIDRDNNMSADDEYFEYHVSMRPKDLVVGTGFVNDKVTSSVKLADGTTQTYTWYQFRVPITSYQSAVGGIQDFKSIRFMRMYMTGFADTSILRFAELQLVRGDWRAFNSDNNPANVIADPAIVNPVTDHSTFVVGTVNIEANGNRQPIPYVVPPGIQRQTNYSGINANTKLNEQSLSLTVNNLTDGYSQAAFKTFNNDLRNYKNLQMFVHAEALPANTLNNGDLHTFIRLGLDYTENYYEYEIPLTVTQPGSSNPNSIWPAANQIDLELDLLTKAKLARNGAKYKGQPWPLTVPYTVTIGTAKITIMGQPDLNRLTTVMLGVRNPYKGNNPSNDDGLTKSGIVWFDELRLTDFNQRSGWAAIAKADIKLADFADINVSGGEQTAGFGTLDSKIEDRSLDNNSNYSVSANVELGKFFPDKSGVHIPTYINVSSQVSKPLYDPASPDILLSQTLKAATTTKQRDSIKNAAETVTQRKSINFTNVHVAKTNPTAPNKVYDISNFNASYAYTDYEYHDFNTSADFEKTYHLELAYNFSDKPKYYTPFAKIIKSNLLQVFKDINLSLAPSRLNFSIDFDRFDSETTLRNNDPDNIIAIPSTFNNTFTITKVFGIGWNLTKSLSLNFDATNLSTVDEPQGPLTGLNRDTLYNNLAHLGRTTNYNHTFGATYAVPFRKIPYMDWITANASYSAHFNWLAEPGFSVDEPQFNVGNSIQNSRTILFNPTFNFTTLYNKFPFLRTNNKDEGSKFSKFLKGLLTSVKNLNVTYTRTEGIFLPGYLPQSTVFGEDPTYNAPGVGFLLGSQSDIRARAVENGWISNDTLQNQLYVKTYNSDLHFNGTVEPIPGLRIILTAFKTQDHTYQTNFKYLDATSSFENLSPVTTGDYSMSYITIGTAFSKISGINNNSQTYNIFMNDRAIISQRLGKLNPNSVGSTNSFADGYGPNSQNVLVPAFLAAYTGKNPSSSNLSQFPNIPLPNWQITYGGLTKLPFIGDIFDSFDIKHAYSSTYNVGGYTTLLQYTENNGSASSRDINNDFLPIFQFSQVTIFEQFAPLLGIDMRFKNNVTTSFSYMQSRALSLSLLNSQLAQQNEDDVVVSFGYKAKNFRFPFGLWENFILKNDLTFNLAFAIRNSKTLIFQPDVLTAQVSSGADNITYRPEINYALSDRFNISFFYDANITKPYTSQSFNTSFTTFGFNLKLIMQ